MGKLYWVMNADGEENKACASRIYREILAEKENVVLLSTEEVRQAHRYPFDEEESMEAWKKSETRDIMMIRYLAEQDIDVVYCSPCEFKETKAWAKENIAEVEMIEGDETGLSHSEEPIPSRDYGTMYWVTGLSGAGKTTVGKMLYQRIRAGKKNVLLMDGDMFRDAMHIPRDYSREAREQLSYRNVRLAKLLVDKGLDIIWCTICMFEGVREWNRKHIGRYVEIYLKVPMDILEKRRTELYRGAKDGSVKNVVGINQEAEYPSRPDVTVCNDGSRLPEDIAEEIWQEIHPWRQITDGREMERIIPQLRAQIEYSLYTYIDLMKYGLQDKDMELYSISSRETEADDLALRYHNGLNLVGMGSRHDGRSLMRLVNHLKPSIISARLDLVEYLHEKVKADYVMESGYVLKWSGRKKAACDGGVELAQPEECREIAELILGEESIGGYYELEDMTRQLTQRMKEGMGRNYFIRQKGKIISHCATYGEYGDVAVIGGVITKAGYRKKGFFGRIFMTLIHELEQEGKNIFLFAFGENLRKMYEDQGMEVVGLWGRLVRKQG